MAPALAPAESYRGPIALSASRYASAQHRAQLAAFPSAAPTNTASNGGGGDTTIATKEQIAVSEAKADLNADAQLAVARNETLKQEVEECTAKVTKSLSAISTIHGLLNLIRASVREESPTCAETSLNAVDTLWRELERLHAAAQATKTALPFFLEKQKDNMSLYHSAMVNETFLETQEELNLQHKKINIQHSLILDHQQAFADHKGHVAPKLKELDDMRDRASSLTLEKGFLRTELDYSQKQLEGVRSEKEVEAQKMRDLQKEVEVLIVTTRDVTAEADALRKVVVDLQEQATAAESKANKNHKTEMQGISEQCDREVKKVTALDALVKALKRNDANVKQEAEKLKAELTMAQLKYNNQSAEFSKQFKDLSEQNKKVNMLNANVERLEKYNGELKDRVNKLDQLQVDAAEMIRAKGKLQVQLTKLNTDLESARNGAAQAKEAAERSSAKLEALEKDNERLEEENNDLFAGVAEARNNSKSLSAAETKNEQLATTIKELERKLAAAEESMPSEVATLQAALRAEKDAKLDKAKEVAEWQELARGSYNGYKDLLSERQQTDELKKENEKLRAQVAELASTSNGVTTDSSNNEHWREKYDELLEKYS